MNTRLPLDPLQHPDTVRQLLYGLHMAGGAHRYAHEHIDARPPGSREAAATVYMLRIEAVARAIDQLLDMQDLLRREAAGLDEAALVAALEAELSAANINMQTEDTRP